MQTWCWSVSAPPFGSGWLCPGPAPESQALAALHPSVLPGGSYWSPLPFLPSPEPLLFVSFGWSVRQPTPTPRCPGPAPGIALGPRGPLQTGGAQEAAGAWQEPCLTVLGGKSPRGSWSSVQPSWGAVGGSKNRCCRRPGRRGPKAPLRREAHSAGLQSCRRRQLFPSREQRGAEKGSQTEGGGAGLSAGGGGGRCSRPQLHPSWAAVGRVEEAPGRWRPLAGAGLVPSAGSDRASRRHAGVELH